MYNTHEKWLKIKLISAFDNISINDLTELLNEFEKFKKEKDQIGACRRYLITSILQIRKLSAKQQGIVVR